MQHFFTGLWRHTHFRKLWFAQTISQFGSQVTVLALPLTAVLLLRATPTQMGILSALEFAPFLLLSLFAGVWVDRLPRRPILIVSDLGRAVLLGTIPGLAWLGVLQMSHLYLVAALVGVCTVCFDVADQSYLLSLVAREHLVEGNVKLQTSSSLAQIAGPGVGGVLVQVLTAPLALAIDALSFVVSALALASITKAEAPPLQLAPRRAVWSEIREGLRVVFGNGSLRAIAACTSTSNLFSNMYGAVFTIFVVRELGLEPAVLGMIYGVGSVGALFGALVAARLARRYGVGRTIIGTMALGSTGPLVVPFVAGSPAVIVAVLTTSWLIASIGGTIYNINQVSFRQAITPDRLQGRMNASMRFVVWGTIPLGSLLGGVLGDAIGLRSTLLIGAVGGLGSFLWVLFSPVRNLTQQPPLTEEQPEAQTSAGSEQN